MNDAKGIDIQDRLCFIKKQSLFSYEIKIVKSYNRYYGQRYSFQQKCSSCLICIKYEYIKKLTKTVSFTFAGCRPKPCGSGGNIREVKGG